MKTLLSLAVLALLFVGCSKQTNPFASKIPNGRYEGTMIMLDFKGNPSGQRLVTEEFDASEGLVVSPNGNKKPFEVRSGVIYIKGVEYGKIRKDGSIMVFGFEPHYNDFVMEKVSN